MYNSDDILEFPIAHLAKREGLNSIVFKGEDDCSPGISTEFQQQCSNQEIQSPPDVCNTD